MPFLAQYVMTLMSMTRAAIQDNSHITQCDIGVPSQGSLHMQQKQSAPMSPSMISITFFILFFL